MPPSLRLEELRRIFRKRRSRPAPPVGDSLNAPAKRQVVHSVLAAALAIVWSFGGWPGSGSADSATAVGPPAAGAALTVITFNIQVTNRQTASAAAYLVTGEADLVAIQEYDERRHAPFISAVAERFPHRLVCPAGLVILTALPVIDSGCQPIGDESLRQLAWMQIEVDGHEATVVNTHLYHLLMHARHRPQWQEWPAFASTVLRNAGRQSQQFTDLAAFLNAQSGPVIVLGDLNAFPGSPLLHRFLQDADLAFGEVDLLPTRPAQAPVIAIDHVLAGRGATVATRRTGPDLGSDHLPVEAVVILGG